MVGQVVRFANNFRDGTVKVMTLESNLKTVSDWERAHARERELETRGRAKADHISGLLYSPFNY